MSSAIDPSIKNSSDVNFGVTDINSKEILQIQAVSIRFA